MRLGHQGAVLGEQPFPLGPGFVGHLDDLKLPMLALVEGFRQGTPSELREDREEQQEDDDRREAEPRPEFEDVGLRLGVELTALVGVGLVAGRLVDVGARWGWPGRRRPGRA